MSKRWMQTLACGVAALFAAAPAFAADTIKLGVAGAHSGELASYGTPSLNAAMLVAEEFNARGGVMGKQVEIVAQDDLCKAEVATAAATKLISDGVAAVMGHICSGPCKATLPLYTNANMISMVAFRDHPLPDPERPEPHVFPHHRPTTTIPPSSARNSLSRR